MPPTTAGNKKLSTGDKTMSNYGESKMFKKPCTCGNTYYTKELDLVDGDIVYFWQCTNCSETKPVRTRKAADTLYYIWVRGKHWSGVSGSYNGNYGLTELGKRLKTWKTKKAAMRHLETAKRLYDDFNDVTLEEISLND